MFVTWHKREQQHTHTALLRRGNKSHNKMGASTSHHNMQVYKSGDLHSTSAKGSIHAHRAMAA